MNPIHSRFILNILKLSSPVSHQNPIQLLDRSNWLNAPSPVATRKPTHSDAVSKIRITSSSAFTVKPMGWQFYEKIYSPVIFEALFGSMLDVLLGSIADLSSGLICDLRNGSMCDLLRGSIWDLLLGFIWDLRWGSIWLLLLGSIWERLLGSMWDLVFGLIWDREAGSRVEGIFISFLIIRHV